MNGRNGDYTITVNDEDGRLFIYTNNYSHGCSITLTIDHEEELLVYLSERREKRLKERLENPSISFT